MKIFLIKPRGFCAGVARAIKTLELSLTKFGSPIYVRHAIVHNQHIVDDFKKKGVIFVESLADVPEGSCVVFSAHGVSPAIREKARERQLKVIDATCPLVTKVHQEAIRYAKLGYAIILIGHKGHVELEGIAGEAPDKIQIIETAKEVDSLKMPDYSKVIVLTQTTLSVDDTKEIIKILKKKFPALKVPSKKDICFSTQNRQAAVKQVTSICDLVLVVGDPKSSNANRLKEVAEKQGAKAYLIKDSAEIDLKWFRSVVAVAITAGASTPEHLVEQVVVHLQKQGFDEVEEVRVMEENIIFPLPKEIQNQ